MRLTRDIVQLSGLNILNSQFVLSCYTIQEFLEFFYTVPFWTRILIGIQFFRAFLITKFKNQDPLCSLWFLDQFPFVLHFLLGGKMASGP